VPQFYIEYVEIDDRNRDYITKRGLTEDDYWYMLMGSLQASRNKHGRSADFQVVTVAPDGSRWRVCFQYLEGIARPITAYPA